MSTPRDSRGARELSVVQQYQAALLARTAPTDSNAAALNLVFKDVWSPIYALCLRFTGSPERARDLTQETMLRALERIAQFRGQASFRAWLYAIARSVCLNAMRHPVDTLFEDDVLERSGEAARVLQELDAAQRTSLVREAIRTALDPVEEEALYLRYVEGLPVERVTDLLELTTAAGARGLLQRCRKKLGRELRSRLAEIGRGSSWVREPL
jgi:RNA polymerase sigma factor (sigma-70 family)